MTSAANPHNAVCLMLTRAIGRTRTVEEIYSIALDALASGIGVERASILLFEPDGVMRFKAYRGLAEAYRRAVEGHTPWTPETPDPEPIVVPDVARDPSLAAYLPIIEAERIAAMTFIPLVSLNRVIGKFMLYFDVPHSPSADEIELAGIIAAQVAFAVERTRAQDEARRREEQLRFALDAASMGTWDWELATNTIRWSENLEAIHGLPPGTFDGSFGSYEREIHPADRERVLASVRRAIAEGVPHDVEYRIVAPDGSVRWCEGKGRVEYRDGQPVRMSGVCVMVTRRKEAELARLAAAEDASRLKDDFLATLSHELRTPLNAILGWVQMLQGGGLPPARAREALDVIGRNARLQAQLIEDILDVSRIITGKLEIERVPVMVAPLVDTVVAGALPAASARQITITRSGTGDLPLVEGDPKRLHQVFGNVLSNAVKFTPDGGRIELTCDAEGTWLSVQVRDSGIGIPADFLPYVFDRFRQADSRSTRKHGGLGLGLAIARHLVERHGGEMLAHSDGPGCGTTITIRLPAASAAPYDVLVPVRPAPQAEDLRFDGVTVMVVDDQRDSRELVAALLEQRGARVVQCVSATDALDGLRSTPAQLLIADIAMPEVDGYQLMRRVRALGTGIPAIAVTSYARPEDRHEALAAGYAAYCAKPVDGPQLLRTARDLLSTP